DNGRVVGYISVGRYLSAEYLAGQKKISGNDLLLIMEGVPYASTLQTDGEPARYASTHGGIEAKGIRYSVREQAIAAINGRPLGLLVSALSDETLDAAVLKLRRLMFGMLLLVAAVSYGIARLFVRKLVEPLRKITLFTEKVSRGELDEALALSGRDEIAVLGAHFNKMRLQLRADRDTVHKYTVDLEHVIGERTAELRRVQDQLLHAQKMEAIGQMAGGIAHDFNNILTAIIGYAGILQRKLPAEDPLRQYTDQVLGAARRATTLTHGLLAFSRKQVLELRENDVNDIIRQVERLLARLITEDIELDTDLADCVLPIMADRGQVEQVLMNLVANARDAMPLGGRLSIRTGVVAYDDHCIYGRTGKTHGEFAVLSVADTGVGMDEKTKKKIFEPFFTTKEVGKGTGLGLAMVYGIIQQHDGCLTVESAIGKGTTFSVYFPLHAAARAGETKVAAVRSPKGGVETILLGEDDGDIRELTRTGLEEAGYTVITAVDGADAVEKFLKHRHRIDLLLLDVVMPKKNGKEVLEAAQLAVPSMRAIFMSGYSADIIKRKGLSSGNGSTFLMKPVDRESLLTAVREVLDRMGAARS
nr:ATP-binding protein [Nitrospiraceae bacterium]